MIHGYHVIFGAYGFWLPNDPRGSWSDFVGAWELVRFGRATKALDRATLTPDQERQRQTAKQALKYKPVQLTGLQARAAGLGFAMACAKSQLTIWACSILPEHVHLVIARHTHNIEQIANLMKGEATKQFNKEGLHPFSSHGCGGERPPSPWARGQWKVFLDTEEAIENAIRYVQENPVNEGKPRQTWSFVRPFAGIDRAGVVNYH
ncbi:MAG: transposase [Pirellulales bacterium]|nr:transposase [Pirellulales bacterium]